jgi:4-amino-4-deoxy-L-arabinose transferase-like glycosyltransferase
MEKDRLYLGLLIFTTLLVCFSLLEYGFYSIDEESYAYLTRSLVKERQFHFETDYAQTRSQLSRAHLSVLSKDKVYSAFPPGYPFLATPFNQFFGINGMQLANIVYTVLLVVTFYFFIKEYYTSSDAFFGSLILLLGTQILNYSVSLWSHIPAAWLLLLSFYLLFKERYLLSGLTIGVSIISRYSGVVIVPFLLFYLYKKNRGKLPRFLIGLLGGLAPLLFYNQVAFGSPFTSGMSILNAEEGYKTVNPEILPKAIVTNLLHYTFFPELELMPDKASLLETSPFLVFSLLGAVLFWKKKRKKRLEFYTLLAGLLVFVLFISGTWSLGGLAHNMRLLTDIVPLITFFAVVPIFYFGLNYLKVLSVSALLVILLYFYDLPFNGVKFFNLYLSILSLAVILGGALLRKDFSNGVWKKIFFVLVTFIFSFSVFTAFSVTTLESSNRKNVKAAALTFEKTTPENSVVFIFGGDYPTYTNKDYTFLDYRYVPEDIPFIVGYYKNRPKYVLFKDEKDKEAFKDFELVPAGPLRTYEIKTRDN